MKPENKIMFFVVSLLVATTILDLYTALSSPAFKLAETNPVYLLSKSSVFMSIGALLIIGLVWYKLKTSLSETVVYGMVFIMLLFSWAHIFGAISNYGATIQYNNDPEGFAKHMESVSDNDKAWTYGVMVIGLFIAPGLCGLVAFSLGKNITDLKWKERAETIDKIYKLVKKIRE